MHVWCIFYSTFRVKILSTGFMHMQYLPAQSSEWHPVWLLPIFFLIVILTSLLTGPAAFVPTSTEKPRWSFYCLIGCNLTDYGRSSFQRGKVSLSIHLSLSVLHFFLPSRHSCSYSFILFTLCGWQTALIDRLKAKGSSMLSAGDRKTPATIQLSVLDCLCLIIQTHHTHIHTHPLTQSFVEKQKGSSSFGYVCIRLLLFLGHVTNS